MDENETVEEFAEQLATAADNFPEAEMSTGVMQDMRSGGYFFEVNSATGRFTVLVTAIEDGGDES